MRGKGKPFKKGHKVKSPGRPELPQEVKTIRKYNSSRLSELLNKYSDLPLNELEDLAWSKTLPAFEIIVIRALVWAIKKNDKSSRDFIIERLCGKVPNDIKLEGQMTHKTINEYISEEIEKLPDYWD